MGQGKDKVKIKHYVFRIEFQARGMPHIHGVAWIDEECLKKDFDIEGDLLDQPEKIQKLVDTSDMSFFDL